MNLKCGDPCVSNICGPEATCIALNHRATCRCREGLVGDPFYRCEAPPRIPPPEGAPCQRTPCGRNAVCKEVNRAASCTCIREYFGDPFVECIPECVQNSDCPTHKACQSNKCVDPCPGVCGSGAQCHVRNRVPTCVCPPGYQGNPFAFCTPIPERIEPPPRPTPCFPDPCGPFSECKAVGDNSVCSCRPTYIGAPPNCRPECLTNSDCATTQACQSQKCRDPCIGTCGHGATCRVINHSPICTCPSGFTGDPFSGCYAVEPQRVDQPRPDPCQPNPCGPYSTCEPYGDQYRCTCLPMYLGPPPNCRPECTVNSDCPSNKACSNLKCIDPCPGACGVNAECRVINHIANCFCVQGYQGNPFSACQPIPRPVEVRIEPCNPSPCGSNAECRTRDGVGASCTCLPEFFGDPYVGCRPECTINDDCPSNKACIRNKCGDPCPGICGRNAQCEVRNHIPTCTCITGYQGDPFSECRVIPPIEKPKQNPCHPTPCGPFSTCRVHYEQAICSCLEGYVGAPPQCRPECVSNPECPLDKACMNQKCGDPCPGACGLNANCRVVNHAPICTCRQGMTGDPFSGCYPIPPVQEERKNPCIPSPCGPNAEGTVQGDICQCRCLHNYQGSPPHQPCRPECTVNEECRQDQSCVSLKCGDPCAQTICAPQAKCSVVNHRASCTCPSPLEGNPYVRCEQRFVPPYEPESSPCSSSPCGRNAICREVNRAASCTCIPGYFGDPFVECRPECVHNSDCPSNKACQNQKCVDPCPGVCGTNARCHVLTHTPSCSCFEGYEGNPYVLCHRIVIKQEPPPPPTPCYPDPCGPFSVCRGVGGNSVCSCLPNYIGQPPSKPQCLTNSECDLSKACQNQKCVDPCPGACSPNAICRVHNHVPLCSCPEGYQGDPFTGCSPIPPPVKDVKDPCYPSPCGPYSTCEAFGDQARCSCLPLYIGPAPYCHPECTVSSDCPSDKACSNLKCVDPCPGACGVNAECRATNHIANCFCVRGYQGNPFSACQLIPPPDVKRPPPQYPCHPSPCGANAECRTRDGVGASCTCIPEFFGDPYVGCRPECVTSDDCSQDKACRRNKCVDPCPGVCGVNARCEVRNHVPTCTCLLGRFGDSFSECRELPPPPPQPTPTPDPCYPSPCGPFATCRNQYGQAICTCLQGYIGSAPNCRPECVSSPECPLDKACVNQKCENPCPGACAYNAECRVLNHSPICTCRQGMTGDPFSGCQYIPPPSEVVKGNPCVPNRCGPNADGTVVGDQCHCNCRPGYFGSPPGCRTECTVNEDCAHDKACISLKCLDPCPGACGSNAICRVINHIPRCSCKPGFIGDALSYCTPEPPPPPKPPVQPDIRCGQNAQRIGQHQCKCYPEYFGDPFTECRPECIRNEDCSWDKSCRRNKCEDPCPGTCGLNAICRVVNHNPTCNCYEGYYGNPYQSCSIRREEPPPAPPSRPCTPNPCGPFSVCRESNGQAICSCQPTYVGVAPFCRPECSVNSDCSLQQACRNQKCVDPCPGSCGDRAICRVIRHIPICSCPSGMTGDPMYSCIPIPPEPPVQKIPVRPDYTPNPCVPSPCGPNSECRPTGPTPSCSCRVGYFGSPPSCRPECVENPECSSKPSPECSSSLLPLKVPQ